MKYDVITIGTAKIDIFLTFNDTNHVCRLDAKTGELCFKHGEKIEVAKSTFTVGGNAMNVVIGLSRLGVKATIAAEIGDDEFSLKIVNTLGKEHIDRGFVKQAHGQESSFSVALNVKGDRTLFSEHVKRAHNLWYDDAKTAWLYLTSLGEEWEHAYEKAVAYVREHDCGLAFNPGTLQLAKKAAVIEDALANTDILFVNKEEAKRLLAYYAKEGGSHDDIPKLLTSVQTLGPRIVVITDGASGSSAIDEQGSILHEPIHEGPVVERTGAGDAFASGFLSAWAHKKTLQEALSWGSENARGVIGAIGAQAGLLKKEAMEERLSK